MAFQPSADFFGIRCLGFKCSWWHQRQVNDAVASERSIFSESHDYKSFSGVTMNTYIPILRGLYRCTWWQKTTNRHTDPMVAEWGQIQFFVRKHLHKYKTSTFTHVQNLFQVQNLFLCSYYDLPPVPLFAHAQRPASRTVYYKFS